MNPAVLVFHAPASPGDTDLSFDTGSGFDGGVYAVVLQSDAKLVIGGAFNTVKGGARSNIARLNADGSLDTAFDPGKGANHELRSLALQSDGKVLIAGHFTMVNGTNRNYIARLNVNGSLDTTFDPGTGANLDVDASHEAMAVIDVEYQDAFARSALLCGVGRAQIEVALQTRVGAAHK